MTDSSAPNRQQVHNQDSTLRLVRGLSLTDSVLLIVSGVIGSSIFLTAKDIASVLPNPALFLLVWILGGLLSLFACFAFAELVSMFPDSGGQYVYLREAFGDLPAFLYGWMIFTVSNGGGIAALAVATAVYLGKVFPALSQDHVIFRIGITLTRVHLTAVVAIGLVTLVNIVGLRRGAFVQNLSTWVKLGGIAAFVLFGLTIGKGDWHHFHTRMPMALSVSSSAVKPGHLLSTLGLALIAVFWAYDGWVYITWVAGEVKNPRRNVRLAMVMGVLAVTAIYVAINMTYIYAFRLSDIAKYETIGQAAAITLFSPEAAIWLSAIVAISSFSSMAACILSGSRVYYAMACDGVFFKRMAQVHPKWRTPAFSLIGQGAWAAVLTVSGRYDQLYTYVMFMMVLSYTLTVAAVFVLRWKRPDVPRPYRCSGYPWLPAIYIFIGTVWAANTVFVRPREALAGIAIVLAGIPGYLFWKSRRPL